MVKIRNLVKIGNQEVKKRYIGNKLIFEDLGDKTEILSGEEIYTDKTDDSVVRVEIDGKSYQDGVPTPDYPIEIHSLNDFDVVSQKSEGGGRNLLPQSGDFTGKPSHFWTNNGGGLTFDDSITHNGYGTIKTSLGSGITGEWLKLENGVEYTYSVLIRSVVPFEGTGDAPLHYHAGKDNQTQYKLTIIDYMTSYTSEDIGKFKKIWMTFRLTGDADSFRPFLFRGVNGDANIAYLKLEKGNKATDWTPAPEDISESDNHPLIDKINLSLSEPLRSVYDVKDRLFKDSDGLWKIVRSVGEEVFENGDKWNNDYYYARETSAVYGISYANANYMKEGGIISLSHVPDDRIGPGTDENEGWLQTNPRLRIRLQHIVIGTTQPSVSAFKAWLKKEHDNGTPLTIVYELAEPTIEILDQELQDKLNNLRSFRGSNYVYTVLNKTDILPTVAENLKPTLHATFKSKGWYDYYLKTLLK